MRTSHPPRTVTQTELFETAAKVKDSKLGADVTFEYDPTSSMRRVTILGYVQNPNKCDIIEDLGFGLDD